MKQETQHIADLIYGSIRGTITGEERAELQDWINRDPENKRLFEEACNPLKQLKKLEVYQLFDREKAWASIEDELFSKPTLSLSGRQFWRVAAGIAIPMMIAASALIYILNDRGMESFAVLDEEFYPGTEKAVLILSDGARVNLEEPGTPDEIKEGRFRIRNLGKILSYENQDVQAEVTAAVYNQLITPPGGTYNLVLADGSRVWLNAGSSLRFPVTFNDSTRRVELNGEGYFEVTKGEKAFIVESGGLEVRVLGTAFNISSYPDEASVKTTLVEGQVRVEVRDSTRIRVLSRVIAPNEQAVLDRSSWNLRVSEVNVSIFTSWTKGKTEFDDETLEMVMKRLSRWYDFEYRFENEEAKSYHFSARLDRNEKISDILDMLELTTDVEFDYRRNTIIVR